jgi:ApaG protein
MLDGLYAVCPSYLNLMSTQSSPAIALAEGPAVRSPVAIQVHVRSQRATPSSQEFAFSLWVSVHNPGPSSVRLLSRRWQYCDAFHHQTDLNGPCVSGQQPEILPGATYSFAASVVLLTEWGSLEGCLRFLDCQGALFEVEFERVMLVPGSAEPIWADQI